MKKMNITLSISTLVVAISFVLGCALIVAGWREMKLAEIKEIAVQNCIEASSYTFENNEGVTTVEPIERTYMKCLELKGY